MNLFVLCSGDRDNRTCQWVGSGKWEKEVSRISLRFLASVTMGMIVPPTNM